MSGTLPFNYHFRALAPFQHFFWLIWYLISGTIDILPKQTIAGLSSLGVPGVPWHTHILSDQLTLFQPGGTDYAHRITTGTPGCLDLPTALDSPFQFFFCSIND